MTTKRKPYIRSMAPNWWQKLGFYRFYILRESTAVTTMWFSILLIYGLFALKGGTQSWHEFVTFLQNPVILL
ncbi:fumarate reductase subunit C, partial [Enterobacter hormaechei]|nr:fumarate reductase subunit C [Enterobacter hormaechei]